jgi:hypothetical protein
MLAARVFIADDALFMRNMLREILRRPAGFSVAK